MTNVWVFSRGVAAGFAALVLSGTPAAAQYGALDGEWRSYGGDVGGTKYSSLDQIDASNFSSLELAWSWTTVDAMLSMEIAGASGRPAPRTSSTSFRNRRRSCGGPMRTRASST